MADVSKADLQKSQNELRELGEQVRDVRQQMQALTVRADRSEELDKKMESNMWFVIGAKWFVGATFVAILGGLVSFVWTFATLSSNVNHHDKTIDNLDKSVREAQKSNADLAKLIIERFPSRLATALVSEGKIVEIAPGRLVIEIEGKDRQTFKLTRKTKFVRGDKPIELTELKSGQGVRILVGEDMHAESVELMSE
jgi:uncharacterized protein YoxC